MKLSLLSFTLYMLVGILALADEPCTVAELLFSPQSKSPTYTEKSEDFGELLKAANDGNPEAQVKVAERYYRGRGVFRAKAIALYIKAAQQGYPPALDMLALFYRDGYEEYGDSFG